MRVLMREWGTIETHMPANNSLTFLDYEADGSIWSHSDGDAQLGLALPLCQLPLVPAAVQGHNAHVSPDALAQPCATNPSRPDSYRAHLRTISTSASLASSSANLRPTHIRGPPPNGAYASGCEGSGLSPRKRSGLQRAGREGTVTPQGH